MKKTKVLIMVLIVSLLVLLIPNLSNAAIEVTKEVYGNNGSAKYIFKGLKLDATHEYEFGITKTKAAQVEKWHLITEYSETDATVNISGGTREFTDVITAVDTGYITIRDKNEPETLVVDHHPIDLTIPYLNITNFTVLNNGKEFGSSQGQSININCWTAGNSKAYFQYEKISDEKVISKYKEIKAKNGDFNELKPLLKTKSPTSNWTTWNYWNGYGGTDSVGYGCPEHQINAPDYGLYYMWIYLAGNNIKDLYGYILVDNLQPEIALDSISLPKTAQVKMGETLTLNPTFKPENTTNKIVTWNSSDESVATVDNAGKVTPKKIGSTIITVTSQDGNKKANCTVTVVAKSTDSGNNNGGNNNNGNTNNGSTNNGNTNNGNNNNGNNNTGSGANKGNTATGNGTNNGKDNTLASGTIPQTGENMFIFVAIAIVIISGAIAMYQYRKNKDIK